MARLILFLMAFVLALPAIADDDNKGRAGVMKALRADCEREANQLNLVGKERKMFVKDCTKEGKHVNKRRRDDRRDRDRHENGRPAAARPAQPAQPPAAPPPTTTAPAQPAPPPPATTAPAQPAPPPPATTAPAQPAPPPSQPAPTTTQSSPAAPPASAPPRATLPSTTAQTSGTVMTAEQKRAKCADEAKRTGVPIPQRMRFVETCMAR